MPRRSNPFQRLIAGIYSQMQTCDGATVSESAMVPERSSGGEREVDILIERVLAGVRIRIAVECRDYGTKNDVTWIDELIGKYRDLDVQKVIAVSSSGFSPAAQAKARDNHIELRTLEQAIITDWPSELASIQAQVLTREDGWLILEVELDPVPDRPIDWSIIGFPVDGAPAPVSLNEYIDLLFTKSIQDQVTKLIGSCPPELAAVSPENPCRLFRDITVRLDPTLLVLMDGRSFQVTSLHLRIQSTFTVDPNAVTHYRFDGATITEATFDSEDGSPEQIISLVQFPDSDQAVLLEGPVKKRRKPGRKATSS